MYRAGERQKRATQNEPTGSQYRVPLKTHRIILITGKGSELYAGTFIGRYETSHSAHRTCSRCEGNHGTFFSYG
jgi:hypothetical protein